MSRKIQLILACFFNLIAFITASDTLSLPVIYPSALTAYDIEQGLKFSCIEETFTDPKGRMWINPCRELDIHKKQRFFQFDGNKSYSITLPGTRDATDASSWFIIGINDNGLIYGSNLNFTNAFFFDPDSQESQIYSLEKGERILDILEQQGDEFIVLTHSATAYSVYKITKDQKQLQSSIELKMPNIDLSVPKTIPATQADQEIWFVHGNIGFIQYNLTEKNYQLYRWEDLVEQNETLKSLAIEFQNVGLIATSNENLLFYAGQVHGFFDFDIKASVLSPNLQLNRQLYSLPIDNERVGGIQLIKDDTGNLLIIFVWSKTGVIHMQQKIFLLDVEGILYTYQTLMEEVALASRYGQAFSDDRPVHANYISSQDFKKYANISTDGGLVTAEIRVDLAINVFAKGWPSRTIIELSPNKFAVFSDNGFFRLVDIQEGEDTYLSQNIGPLICGENIYPSPFSQAVSQSNGQVWFTTGNHLVPTHRLISFRKNQNTCEQYMVDQQFDKFSFLNEQEVLLVNYQHELFIYDLENRSSRPFTSNGDTVNIGGNANELLIGRKGVHWIASLNGLWKVDPKTKDIIHIDEKNGLQDNQVICLHEADNGYIWIGTLNGGVHIYNPQTGEVKVIDESSGLSNNAVVGILADEEGDKWVATFSGITVLSRHGEILFKLYEKDGLSHKEFNRFSYHKTIGGKLVFGSVAGVNVLEPKKIKPAFTQKQKLQLYLTEISYFSKKLKKDTLLRGQFESIEQITLPATHRYLSLDFSLSDYIHTQNSTFAYQLRKTAGLAQETTGTWNNLGNNSYLSLHNLPSGKHTIVIRGTDHTGHVIEEMISIPIRVKEFFYKSWWFYLLCTLPFVVGVFLWNRRLVTEKKRLEAEVEKRTYEIRQDKEIIEEQAIKLQELDEMKSRFFTNISHEFRTPLTVISGMVNQVKSNPNQWFDKGLELIQRNSQHLLSLINQILDLRKLESGTLKIKKIQGNIIPFLDYIADSFSSMALSNGIKIHFLPNVQKLEMDYDPEKILHIFSNLLSNAIKYSPDGGDIYFQVDHRQGDKEETLVAQVRDTGKGIAPEALPFIFDRFYQVEDLARQKPQGTGIGLALTQELVHLLKGTIEVESQINKGTCFIISFPITRNATLQNLDIRHAQLNQGDNAPPSVLEASALSRAELPNHLDYLEQGEGGGSVPSQYPTLLIVEDNEDVQLYLRSILESHYQLLATVDGQKGIDIALDQVPDVIISDVMMPVINGYELCDTLKNDERTSHIPIILLTAKADFESRMIGLKKAADAYLTKPFKQEELLQILKNLLEIREKLQLKYASGSLVSNSDRPTDANAKPNLDDVFLKKLEQVILDHMDNPKLSSEFISRQIGMSKTNIFRKLKALTNLSLSHFIRRIRLQKAKELLLDPQMNISDVAYAVGFSDPYYFSRVFSETFQQSPSQFRKK